MRQFHIGLYTYFTEPNCYRIYSNDESDTDDIVKSYDQVLHQSLDKIFLESCSSISSSSQFNTFRCDPQHNSDWKSIINPILEQEPILSDHFSKEEIGKLSLLWISVLAGYEKSAELLVRSGADVNEPFGRHDPQMIDENWTVLYVLLQMRCLSENERLIQLVTDHGADLQARVYKGRTVLHYAVEKNLVPMVEMLLEKGANVNAADYLGITPLLFAATSSKANELMPLLIKHGADIFAKDRDKLNVLHYLSLDYHEEPVADLARVLIEKGVSLEDKSVGQQQPIHLAATKANDELVKFFLDHGANVNALTRRKKSPLYLAALSNKPKVLETLIKHSADVNLKTIEGGTALHAAACGYTRLSEIESKIRLLLSAGANVLAENCNGRTPLYFILRRVNEEHPGTRLLIKSLALRKALKPSIELKDEIFIGQFLPLQEYYQDCMNEINRMKSTRFIETCSFFELFTKNHCQIAKLMRNPEFETKFGQDDLNGFSNYADDIRRAFERAQKHYHAMLEQENVINEAVYNMLPYLVVKKVVYCIFND